MKSKSLHDRCRALATETVREFTNYRTDRAASGRPLGPGDEWAALTDFVSAAIGKAVRAEVRRRRRQGR